MEQNTLSIIINKPAVQVFKFTTNPSNTHLWVPFVDEEIIDKYPIKLGTIYKSRREKYWNESKVTQFKINKLFKLENNKFSVKYKYEIIDENKTKLIYIETIKQGTLTNKFEIKVLEKLKHIVELK
ncbi:MAG: hypothetical protein HRU03_05440 [Nanoarchaeales archaeon]|nr:hypothetical protein [Nanoarchaeales archaeon]